MYFRSLYDILYEYHDSYRFRRGDCAEPTMSFSDVVKEPTEARRPEDSLIIWWRHLPVRFLSTSKHVRLQGLKFPTVGLHLATVQETRTRPSPTAPIASTDLPAPALGFGAWRCYASRECTFWAFIMGSGFEVSEFTGLIGLSSCMLLLHCCLSHVTRSRIQERSSRYSSRLAPSNLRPSIPHCELLGASMR